METPTIASSLRQRKLVNYARGTFNQASELLRKRVPCAEYFFAPKRLWLKRVSTPNCDVVLSLREYVRDSTLLWLLAKLQQTPGIQVTVQYHATTKSSAFYISAAFPVLLQAAEDHHLPKILKSERGGGFKEFLTQDFHCYDLCENEQDFFTSEERQWLILQMLNEMRANRQDIGAVRADFNMLEGQPIIQKCLSAKIITQIFPLHDSNTLERLQHIWVKEFLAQQPLDEISEYFGVKIGLYFAWLGHYTAALSIPAIVGIFFWLCCTGKYQTFEDVGYVIFSIFNMVWVTVYLQAWKRYSAELTFRWGTLDQRADLLAEPRPLFRGELQISPVTGRLEPNYPTWKRNLFRYCASVPIIAICLLVVFLLMFASFKFQIFWDNFLSVSELPTFLNYLPKILLALVISVMDEIYFKVALWLNDLENYRLETNYENHLIGKVALFQFVNSFISLFYIAFYVQDQNCLKDQLAVLLISRQLIGNLKESAVPYLIEHLRYAKMTSALFGAFGGATTTADSARRITSEHKRTVTDAILADVSKEHQKEEDSVRPISETSESGRTDGSSRTKGAHTLSQAEYESTLFQYDGTFADYLEMVIQLGYVILFSSAFPLAAVCALANNFIEIRSDAFKLTYVCQRSFGQRVPNIGTWQSCMEYVSIVAVLVNCGLIALSGQVQRMFPNMNTTQTILLIVVLEHIMLVIRFVITRAIPDKPGWLRTEMAKIEWARRETMKVFSAKSSTSPPTDDSPMSQHLRRFGLPANTSQMFQPFERKSSDNNKSSSEMLTSNLRRESHKSSIPTTPTTTFPAIATTATTTAALDGIQAIPPFRSRKSRKDISQTTPEVTVGDSDHSAHHLMIGPSGGIEWTKSMKLTDDDTHKSTHCLSSFKETSSSDSDLLFRGGANNEGASGWSPQTPSHLTGNNNNDQKNSAFNYGNNNNNNSGGGSFRVRKKGGQGQDVDSMKSASSQEGDEPQPVNKVGEDFAAKKARVKQSLMKRARSVAIFSLKLKERRAREAAHDKNASTTPSMVLPPPQCGGGELSCIPIEKLIQVEDVKNNQSPQQKQKSSQGGLM